MIKSRFFSNAKIDSIAASLSLFYQIIRQNTSYPLGRYYRYSIILTILIVAFGSVLLMNNDIGQMKNNGDYWRVTRAIGLSIKAWTIPESCISSEFRFGMPESTMADLAIIIGFAHKIFAADCFISNSVFWSLSAIYWLGVLMIVMCVSRWRAFLTLIVFSIMYLTFSYYFKSFYEEAPILALSPLMLYSYLTLQLGKPYFFATVTCFIILSKAQMILLAPFVIIFLFIHRPASGGLHHTIASILVVVAVAVSFAGKSEILMQNISMQNSYNRLFNGLGWSLQGVQDWPASNSSTRHNFFNKNQDRLQKITETHEPLSGHRLLGTSFWPTGSNLLKKAIGRQIFSQLSWRLYYQTIPKSLSTLTSILINVYSVGLTSDYSMSYIRSPYQSSNIKFSLEPARLFIHQNLGKIYILMTMTLVVLMLYKSLLPIITLGFYLSVPIFVFVGDGFYEFEKHIIPYVMLLGFFILFPFVQKENESGKGT